jgi:peptidoglycan/LPS O-acetylase OafA/YrhL
MSFLGMAGAPLLWLAAVQTGYVLAYQACDDRSRSWVIVPTVGMLVLVSGIAVLSARTYRRAAADRHPLPLLGLIALAISLLTTLVLAASAIGPFMLHACD